MVAESVGEGEQKSRGDEGDMDADKPIKLAIARVLDVHESLEQLDRRNGHDRGHQFELEFAEIDLGDPMRQAVALAHDHRRDEIRVAGNEYDHHERSHQGHVDDRQHREQDPVIAQRPEVGHDRIELHRGAHEHLEQAERQREIERHQQPAAREQDPLDCGLDHRIPCAPSKAPSRSVMIERGSTIGDPFRVNGQPRASRGDFGAAGRAEATASRRFSRRAARARRPRRAFSPARDRAGRDGS